MRRPRGTDPQSVAAAVVCIRSPAAGPVAISSPPPENVKKGEAPRAGGAHSCSTAHGRLAHTATRNVAGGRL